MAKSKTSVKPLAGRSATKILDSAWIQQQIETFGRQIISQNLLDQAVVVGIRRRGAELARRVREFINRTAKARVPYGALDITLYRDDVAIRGPRLHTQRRGTEIEVSIDTLVVYLIDDVLCTGRTIRAALAELNDLGRPGAVRLYSLIDRGGRELPIQPDHVGKRISVSLADRVDVRLRETDGEEGVFILYGGMR